MSKLEETVVDLLGESLEVRLMKANKGREGKPAINLSGEELSGSTYIGNGSYITKVGSEIFIRMTDGNKVDVILLNTKQANALKKAL